MTIRKLLSYKHVAGSFQLTLTTSTFNHQDIYSMPTIAGVATKKNTKGQLTHITIDVRKHKQAIPVLEELGLIPKTQFDIDFENGHTIEEFKEYLLSIVKKHFADKH